ncbi:MAG: DoxX family protein [Planctomycetota bacterium]
MSNDHTKDLGALIARAMVGIVFVFHGAQKLFGLFGGPGLEGFGGFLQSLGVPFPALSAVLAGSAELFGGLSLLLGVGQRAIGVPLVFTMLVAAFSAHTGFDVQKGGMEYPLTLGAVVAGLALIGPGRFNALTLVQRLRGQPAEGQATAKASAPEPLRV